MLHIGMWTQDSASVYVPQSVMLFSELRKLATGICLQPCTFADLVTLKFHTFAWNLHTTLLPV